MVITRVFIFVVSFVRLQTTSSETVWSDADAAI